MSFVITSFLLNMDRSVAVYNIYNKSLDLKAKLASIITIIILILVVLVNIFIINKIDDSSFAYIVSVVSFAASAFLCMTLFYFVNIIVDTTNNLDITKEYNNKLELYNKAMQELIDIQRRTVHEFNNKMTVLNGYIADKKYDEASLFVTKSLKETKNLDSSLFKNIKNSGLKSLLLFKYAEIKDKNISFELMVNKRIENLIVDSDDVCKILGIFLDNAIEAAINSKNPFISVGIVKIEESINITIMNSIADEHVNYKLSSAKASSEEANNVEKIFREGYSKKGYNRGFGLSIAKDLIERYKGLSCITEIRDGLFIQDLNITKH
jgi:two-component system sensor histidine kinase AgrC